MRRPRVRHRSELFSVQRRWGNCGMASGDLKGQCRERKSFIEITYLSLDAL
ncbi:brain and reproductive organ-expressed protein, isoform CRA_b [Rattus norvegicus]|uniref:Brain and reproductive organ-expressed protein, isoform CRA_b n=1 Tax=Rattus norvegicus TaxID=10116 RepID=A6HA40_RAT|nr:brain and reproductive organ-expressed protein, isoform CRA_b [Rattus norvegicus]EDM02891.1 brain and reproductive organ-expressed protein, isoform CRA_b [Rattus norvegicus]